MTPLYATLAFVAVVRLAELVWAGHSTRRLRRAGAIEIDAAGYPWFVVLHAGWLVSLLALVPPGTTPYWPLLAAYALLQPARLWIILSLGRFWTTRVLTLPQAPLIATGPYRWLRHPNYLVASAEIAVLPLAYGAVGIAAAFSALNLVLIRRRIAIEERALAPRRRL